MQFTVVLIALFAMLAGRVHALNITFGVQGVGNGVNITASQLLTVNDADLTTKCSIPCNNATSLISGCGDTNDSCLCLDTTVQAVAACEQCYFTQLIDENRRMPDPRAGNALALTAYATACNISAAAQPALTLPSNWDGPYGQFLNPGATAFGVIVALILGVGAITIVNTM